jgi:nitroreductase
MELDQAIRNRRAVRDYTGEPVNEAALQQLIEAAILAPSAMNEQPWLFAVVRDKALLARISQESKAGILASAGSAPNPRLERFKDPAFDILHHAPVLIVIAAASKNRWAAENCALAAENLMLAARDAGLGSCWIGLAQNWIETDAGKAALKLPPQSAPIAAIVVGHTASFPPPVPRQPARVTWIG